MRNLVQKLGKLRSWWVFTLAGVTALCVGGPLVGLALIGVRAAHVAGFVLILGCWLVGAAALVVYFNGMFRGRYRQLRGKSWVQLPWSKPTPLRGAA